MAKVLKTAALVVGAVALVATGVGAIGLAGLAGTVSVAGISTGALFAISAGLSVAGALLTKKPNAPANDPTKWKADPFAGIPYVIGRTLNAGNIVYRRSHGSKNKYETFVTILSGAGPIEGIDTFFANRTTVNFSGSGNAAGTYSGCIYQRRQLGACPEPAAMAAPIGSPPGWSAASKLSGYAATIMTLVYDAKGKTTFTSEPTPAWIMRGVKCYDPRLDSTYPGGAGDCRALDESTYVYSENPYVHGLTWCLGRWQNGKRVIGIGAPIGAIDIAAFVEGANLADANGWKIGGVIYSRPDTPWNTLKLMLQGGSGAPVAIGGTISCVFDAPRVSLATISDADIVGECSLAATMPRRSRINGVVPRYRSEAHDWTVVPAELVQVADYVAQDDGERTREVEFALVQDVRQASQLGAYQIGNARELGPGSFPLKPIWMNYRVGDCVTIATREIASMKVVILEREVDPSSAVVTYTVRTETDAKHPFALGLTGAAPPTASLPDYNPVDTAPAAGSWSVTAASSPTGGAALLVSGAADADNADAVIFEYRVVGSADWLSAGLEPANVTSKLIAGLVASTSYEVAVSYQTKGDIGDRLVLGPITASIATSPPTLLAKVSQTDDTATISARAPEYAPFEYLRFYAGSTSDFGSATQVGGNHVLSLGETIQIADSGIGAGPRYYWAVAYSATGVASDPTGPLALNIGGFDFSGGALPSGASLTRSSAGLRTNSSGDLVSEAANVARFDYDPVSHTLLGLLSEPSAANQIANSVLAGGTTGTIGTGSGVVPTGIGVGSNGGLTRDVVALGTINGINYFTIRYHGIANSAGSITLALEPAVSAAGAETWTASAYLALVAGALTGVNTTNMVIRVGGQPGTVLSGLDATPRRYSASATVSSGTNVTATLRWNYLAVGAGVDFTLLVGIPQRESGGKMTSAIKTSGAAATRAADQLTLNWGARGVPDSTMTVRYTFDDGSTQDVATTVSGGLATVPTNLNRSTLMLAQRL